VQKNRTGFTLVELAIVMTIIGLLVGGILKGQELYKNATVTDTVSQIKAIEAAATLFRDKFGTPPGDYSLATTKIQNCTTGNFCLDGNSGYTVDDGLNSDTTTTSILSMGATYWPETTQFWKHLALADFISTVSTEADPASPSVGYTHPKAGIGGGFEAYSDPQTSLAVTGVMLRISRVGISGGDLSAAAGTNYSPVEISQIDMKIDDGLPDTGIFVVNYGTVATVTGCKNLGIYVAIDAQNTCLPAYVMRL
jgi:prepilin-type N-terminal cleavage/methylation domain-containing protein